MKKFSKVSAVILSILLAVSLLLTACGSNTAPASSTAATNVTTTATGGDQASTATGDVKPLDPVSLRMVIAGPPQKDQPLVNDAITKYLKDKLNASITIDQYDWGSWNDKNNLIIASGEDCDLLFSAAWCGYTTNAAKGAFYELSDLLKKYGQDILKTNYTWTLDTAKVDGKLYGIPTYQMLAQSRGFFLRKDLVDKYGPEIGFTIKDVNKPEDLEPMLKLIKEKEPDMTPFYGIPTKLLADLGPWDRQGNQDATTIDITSTNPQYFNFYDSDYYRKSMEIARRWFLAGYVNKDIATTKEAAQTIFTAGKCFAWTGETNVGADEQYQRTTGQPIVMYPVIKPIISTGLVQGAMFVIPRQSKNPERAMMFLDLMHSDKTLVNMLAYGIEGTHYVKKGDNAVDIAPGLDPSKLPYYNHNWMFGNQTFVYTYGNSNPNGAKLLDEFNQNAVKTPALGFSYNPDKMKNELAALANVAAEFNPQLSSGAVDGQKDGLYNKFLSKLKAAGVDKLLEDQNAQLNAWKKANGK